VAEGLAAVADRKPRIWGRWLPFPSPREDQPPPRQMAPQVGSDGIVRGGNYSRSSLGVPTAPAFDEDYGCTWGPPW
jgi:hypothetical protein